MKISYYLSIACVSACFFFGISACDQLGEDGYTETDSGLKIKYLTEGEGSKPDSGYFLLLNMEYFQEDSLLFPPEGVSGPIPIQLASDTINQVFEAFGMLKKGDSAHFQVSAEELYVNTFNSEIPEGMEAANPITFRIGVEDVMSPQNYQAYQMEQMRNMQSEQMEKDSVIINDYLSQNEIDAQTTDNGLRYVIEEEGKGVQPSAGDSVFVHYRGTLMDGTQFDSSYENNRGPFGFVLGQGDVIPGWDEGIALLNEGAKATLYVPSSLAYGPQSIGPIAANSVLIFDVELVDVK